MELRRRTSKGRSSRRANLLLVLVLRLAQLDERGRTSRRCRNLAERLERRVAVQDRDRLGDRRLLLGAEHVALLKLRLLLCAPRSQGRKEFLVIRKAFLCRVLLRRSRGDQLCRLSDLLLSLLEQIRRLVVLLVQ